MLIPTITPEIAAPSSPNEPAKKQVHLPFLDGIRALMALWVATGHGFQDFIHIVDHSTGNTNFCPQPFFQQAFFAHFAVDVFIVLSGFCLMLPVAKQPGFILSGGLKHYLGRRAKRILPPYYAALALALTMSGVRWLITRGGWEANAIQSIDFSLPAIAAHILLIQNLWDPWARAIDGPTWSVATECQIYIVFPLLLLPLWRRLNPFIVVTIASALGVGIYFLTMLGKHPINSGLTSCSWYMGLFAMGMLAAQCYVQKWSKPLRPMLLQLGIAALAAALILIAVFNWMPIQMWALDLIIGGGTAFLLAYFASYTESAVKPAAMKLLEWQPLVTLGTFSYSFYLIHAPILNVPVTLLLKYNANPIVGAISILTTLCAIIHLARIFYHYIELPSMAKQKR